MSPGDRTRLLHMIDAIEAAQRFSAGRARVDLVGDQMLAFALVHSLQIIGEAAARLSPAARQALPDVPWPTIIGMRNRLVHAYFEIDHDILWETVTRSLPPLLVRLRRIAARE